MAVPGGRGQKQGHSCQDLAPQPSRLLLPFLIQPTKCSGLTRGAGVSVPEVHMHVHKRAWTHMPHYFSQGCTLSSLQQAGSFESWLIPTRAQRRGDGNTQAPVTHGPTGHTCRHNTHASAYTSSLRHSLTHRRASVHTSTHVHRLTVTQPHTHGLHYSSGLVTHSIINSALKN